MANATTLAMYAFFAAHVTWRAGSMLRNLDPWDRPGVFSKLGVLGIAVLNGMVPLAFVAAIATLVWAFLRLPWWAPVPLFFVAGAAFALLHNAMLRAAPVRYVGWFPALGAIIGTCSVILTQTMMWAR